jgi:hypothetical protein
VNLRAGLAQASGALQPLYQAPPSCVDELLNRWGRHRITARKETVLMTDDEILQLVAGVYEQIRLLWLEMQTVKAISLATKDTLAEAMPSKQIESLYLVAYKTRLRELGAANEKLLAVIDEQLKSLRS